MKRWIRQFVPSSLLRAYRAQQGVGFVGDYPSWQAGLDVASGYDAPAIFEHAREGALKVKRGEAVFERDSVCFDHEEYRWPTLACLMRVAAEHEGNLRVLDFGGGLGSFYYQHKKHFAYLNQVRWAVVEQSHYVVCGQEEFQDDVLQFHETIEDCLEHGEVDVIFCSSVLQYLELPYAMLVSFAKSGASYILLDRMPFIESDQDRLTVQHVPESIYPASYPAWFFARKRFAEEVNRAGYRELVRFEGDDDAGIGEYKGILLARS